MIIVVASEFQHSFLVMLGACGPALQWCVVDDQNAEEIRQAEGSAPPSASGENTLHWAQRWLWVWTPLPIYITIP